MAERFAGRTAVITGGVSGIGAGIAARLSAEGASLSLWDVDEAGLAKSNASHTVALDVTDPDAVHRAAADTAAALGKIDILVTSAGITGPNVSTWEYPVAAWDKVIDVNLKGVFYCNRAVVPFMQHSGYGRIVNIASLNSFVALSEVAAYAASKAGVASLTRSLAVEWSKKGVTVNAIAPGVFRTDLNANLLDSTPRGQELLMRTPMGRFGKTEELVGAAIYLASDAASFVTGQALVVDGGFLASGVNQ